MFEGRATNSRCSDGRTGAGDWTGSTESGEPDHDLVGGTASGCCAEECVVGDVSDDVGPTVAMMICQRLSHPLNADDSYLHAQLVGIDVN